VGKKPEAVQTDLSATVKQAQAHIEACQYNLALEKVWRQVLDPANQYADKNEPWKLVKTDKDAARTCCLRWRSRCASRRFAQAVLAAVDGDDLPEL